MRRTCRSWPEHRTVISSRDRSTTSVEMFCSPSAQQTSRWTFHFRRSLVESCGILSKRMTSNLLGSLSISSFRDRTPHRSLDIQKPSRDYVVPFQRCQDQPNSESFDTTQESFVFKQMGTGVVTESLTTMASAVRRGSSKAASAAINPILHLWKAKSTALSKLGEEAGKRAAIKVVKRTPAITKRTGDHRKLLCHQQARCQNQLIMFISRYSSNVFLISVMTIPDQLPCVNFGISTQTN